MGQGLFSILTVYDIAAIVPGINGTILVGDNILDNLLKTPPYTKSIHSQKQHP